MVAAASACEINHLPVEQSRVVSSQKMEMYRNVSTAPSYIKLQIKDVRTDTISVMVLENLVFARFLAHERGIKKEKIADFFGREYVEFMLKNAEKPIDVDMGKFADFLAINRVGSKSAAAKYLKSISYGEPMSLQKLGVRTEDELIEKYFQFDRKTCIGTLKPGFTEANEPRFIGLLIDMGYVVGRGDIAPILRIRVPHGAAQ